MIARRARDLANALFADVLLQESDVIKAKMSVGLLAEAKGDVKAAFAWFSEAALDDYRIALAHKARFLLFGMHAVQVNPREAYAAAARSHAEKCTTGSWLVGLMLAQGIVGAADSREHARRILTYAEKDPLAAAELLLLDLKEMKVDHSADRVHAIISRMKELAEDDNTEAWQAAVAQYFLVRYYLAIEDFASAFKHCKLAAESGIADAEYCAGELLDAGKGTAKDSVQAARWFEKAAEQGHSKSIHALCELYLRGDNVQNVEKDLKANKMSAENKRQLGMRDLASIYERGQGTAQDFALAFDWYHKAAEAGDAVAQWNLAICYERGQGVRSDCKAAAEWYRKAAEQGHATSQYALGRYIECGIVGGRNLKEAYRWYQLASEQGHIPAAVACDRFRCCPGGRTQPAVVLPGPYICSSCTMSGPRMLRCAGCLIALYCDRVCQKDAWKDHKLVCPGGRRKQAKKG